MPLPSPFPRRAAVIRAYLVPLTVAMAMFVPGLWYARWLWDPALYTAISLEAARTGEWWTLHHANVTYFNKPPLWFWVHAAFIKVFGDSAWAMRLPDLLAALGCVAATVSIVLRLHGPRAAMLSGVALALCSEYIRRISQFRLDIPHTLFMLLAVRMVLAGVMPARGAKGMRLGWIVGAGVPIGLAMLTKPIFGLLALVLVGVWLVLSGREMRRAAIWLLPAAAVAIMVAAPWHVSQWLRFGDAFTQAYFVRESVGRATGGQFNPEPWYAYFVYLSGIETRLGRRLGGGSVGWTYVPWTLCAIIAVAWCMCGRKLAPRLSRDGGRLAQVWTFGLLIALSVFGDKKSWYLMPVYPGLAWFGSLLVLRLSPRGLKRSAWRLAPVLAALVLGVVLGARPSFERRGAGGGADEAAEPPISPIESFMMAHPEAEYWNGSLHHYDNARLYLRAGVWPRFAKDDNTGERWTPAAGSYLVFDTRRGPPDASDVVVETAGPFVLVRRTREDAAAPVADTAPGR